MSQLAERPQDCQSRVSERSGTRIDILKSVTQIEGIRHIWSAWPGHRDSDIDVYFSLMKSSGPSVEPYVLVLYRGGKPEALLIGRVSRTKMPLRFGYVRLLEPTVRLLDIHYGGLRGKDSPENCEMLVRNVLEDLSADQFDVAVFEPLRFDSNLRSAALNQPGILAKDYVRVARAHRDMRLPRSVAAFHQLRPRVRSDRNRYGNRLKADFGNDVRIESFTQASELGVLIKDVEQVAATSYQRGLGVGFVDSPQIHQLLSLTAEKGWLRGYVLYATGQPCAFVIGTLYQKTLYLDFVGYDPKYSRCSPGTYLLIKKLEDFCSEDVEVVNFGIGDAWYKEYFSTETWEEGPVYIFRQSVKGTALNFAMTVTAIAERTLKKTLLSMGALAGLKKLWRRRISENRNRTS